MEATMENKTSVQNDEYRKYEIDSKECQVCLGEVVTPETILGRHHLTGQRVMAGLLGRIATIYFNPMHNSLLVMVVSVNN